MFQKLTVQLPEDGAALCVQQIVSVSNVVLLLAGAVSTPCAAPPYRFQEKFQLHQAKKSWGCPSWNSVRRHCVEQDWYLNPLLSREQRPLLSRSVVRFSLLVSGTWDGTSSLSAVSGLPCRSWRTVASCCGDLNSPSPVGSFFRHHPPSSSFSSFVVEEI
ncbi:hypothetical protein TcBrA4_0105250 [Trypanosoma cruzi]|nr:hypothetical protein TcBrA4_0105250 [Trypanosoma cruzi]